MNRALVLNGPNLDLLGIREPYIYGTTSLSQLEEQIRGWGAQLGIEVETFQSNHEGDLIDRIHDARTRVDGLVINAGALTHYARALQDALAAVELPAVEVHISNVREREPFRRATVVSPPAIHSIYGRGLAGYQWALRHLHYRAAGPFARISYGSFPDQFGDLRTPAGAGRLVILLHGGLWRQEWTRDTMDGIAVDLAARGYVTWNLEYRRVGSGGGWPESFDDVAAALAAAPDLTGIDREDTALLGHSSGGTMALWAGGSTKGLAPRLTVGMAALTDLVRARDEPATQESIRRLLGRTKPGAAEYSPHHRLPTGTKAIVAAATADDVAPPSRARDFAEQAKIAGDTVAVLEVPGNDSSFLDPGEAAWKNVAEILTRQFGADR